MQAHHNLGPSRFLARRAKVVVGLHPASNGADELDVVRTLGAEHLVMVDTAGAFATDDLLLAAHIVVAWNSTVASQAALLTGPLRKKVCFVDVCAEPDLPLVVIAGLARQAHTGQAVTDFLRDTLEPHGATAESMPLPVGATRNMAEGILKTVRQAR
ncbi:MAG: hypothetical protein EOO40_01440 [Deltaproteobacteria bacterium]|nr:MAG: hypothetical protein EOO40_01440 [Deltaproteobacteria bacterium]